MHGVALKITCYFPSENNTCKNDSVATFAWKTSKEK